MTLLGLNPVIGERGSVRVSVKSGWLRGVLVLSLGAGAGAAGVLTTYKMMQEQPAASFELLAKWGPWFLIAGFAIYVLGQWLQQINTNAGRALDAMVETGKENAAAQNRMADAMARIAEKGDRSMQEIQVLSTYNARQNERMLLGLERIESHLKGNQRTSHEDVGDGSGR